MPFLWLTAPQPTLLLKGAFSCHRGVTAHPEMGDCQLATLGARAYSTASAQESNGSKFWVGWPGLRLLEGGWRFSLLRCHTVCDGSKPLPRASVPQRNCLRTEELMNQGAAVLEPSPVVPCCAWSRARNGVHSRQSTPHSVPSGCTANKNSYCNVKYRREGNSSS